MPVKGDIRLLKSAIREKYRAYRVSLVPSVKHETDEKIRKNVRRLDEYTASDTVFLYVSKPQEIDTFALISDALAEGKRVAVPRCIEGTRDMDFYFLRSLEDLEEGSYGIMEPKPSCCEKVTDFSKGLCILPAFCFDYAGYRLGYGKGYYDRFLNHFCGVTVGVCDSFCMEKNLPHGYFDKPVHVIVTEKFIRRIGRRRRKGGNV